jgi:hypothetical protein
VALPDTAQGLTVVGARIAARDADDDFFCLRFQVWYPSFDCAVRTKFRTCPGCLNCEQGRFNLKRHGAALHNVRWNSPTGCD